MIQQGSIWTSLYSPSLVSAELVLHNLRFQPIQSSICKLNVYFDLLCQVFEKLYQKAMNCQKYSSEAIKNLTIQSKVTYCFYLTRNCLQLLDHLSKTRKNESSLAKCIWVLLCPFEIKDFQNSLTNGTNRIALFKFLINYSQMQRSMACNILEVLGNHKRYNYALSGD